VAVLGFPNPVNEVSARLVAAGVVLMAVATIAFDLQWMTLVLAYGFVARALTGPTLSPLGQLVTRVITPALSIEPRLVAGPPKRFAQAIGAAFTVTAALLTYGADRFDLAQIVLGILLVPAVLEAFVGFCVGCQVFGLLMRAGVVPDEVCEACNDIWSRQPQRA
jgi:ABC-type multidrug transport system fused ATPase/permease subunit